MGIQNLLPFLSKYARKVSLNDLRGKVCGIDVFGWLYKGAYSRAYELVIGETTTKHIEYVVRCVEQLIALQIKPALVFDGITPDMKLPEENRRRESRAKSRENALKSMNEGNIRRGAALMKREISIDHKSVISLVKVCIEKGYDYVVAPYESDAQLTCTYLQKIGLVDYILSKDSDLLVFGSSEFTKVIFKINFDSLDGELIVLKDIFGLSNSFQINFIHSLKICFDTCVYCLAVIIYLR